MSVDPVAACLAAVVAAQCMEVPAYTMRRFGMPVHQDVFAESGAILRAPRWCRRPVGWLGHAALAVGIVLLYSTFFAAVGNDHLVWWGLFAGAVHGGLGGVAIGAWSDLHPTSPTGFRPPACSTATTAGWT